MAMSDKEALDRVAKVLERPEWAADELDDIFHIVSEVRTIALTDAEV